MSLSYVYAVLLLNELKQPIETDKIRAIISATGAEPDENQIAVLVKTLKEVDISKVINTVRTQSINFPYVVERVEQGASIERKEEKKEEEENQSLIGLNELFK